MKGGKKSTYTRAPGDWECEVHATCRNEAFVRHYRLFPSGDIVSIVVCDEHAGEVSDHPRERRPSA